jgi:hypothetical protein
LADSFAENKSKFRFEPLDKKTHNLAAFSCEQESLNSYLKERSSQEIKKRVAAVYVLTPDGKTIAGYYTLSRYSIEAGEFPSELLRQLRLPKYDRLPATLLRRLARSKDFKGADRDQYNEHAVKVVFNDPETRHDRHFSGQVDRITFGSAEYLWHPEGERGHADPDGPPSNSKVIGGAETLYKLPMASITVLRGSLRDQ